MGIRIRQQKTLLALTIMIFGLSSSVLMNASNYYNISTRLHTTFSSEQPRTSKAPLIDKVFTFLSPQDSLSFTDIYLEKHYNYYFLVEMVTPHNCSINVTLWDSDGMQYDLFSGNMHYNPQTGRSFEFPFGTALSGNYTFQFFVDAPSNLNIHIKLEQGVKCLYNIMSGQAINNLVLFRVVRFSNEMTIEHNIQFKTDVSYKFFIGRVSAISVLENNEVRMDYSISDPNSVNFEIYYNNSMVEIGDANQFNFGTETAGVYTIQTKIYCEVNYANIAYSITEDYDISDVIDGNDTDPTNQTLRGYFTLPPEWTMGLVIFAGILIGIIVMLINIRKRRNTIYLNLKEKFS